MLGGQEPRSIRKLEVDNKKLRRANETLRETSVFSTEMDCDIKKTRWSFSSRII